ncbi:MULTISPECIES: Eco57I restriction-modification methylase domain-containing protein [unclassified Novosphingobium]|uniref:Eco57I restriction-modification methylase domain-containing protein n=1 Tax=unclassified Novosphingobium TaxID=2644732 RepID=UPI00135A7957|nr:MULTISPECIES: Eco57I restriction-modification methylase domain-containing protein [unclassified Novosphingobium]
MAVANTRDEGRAAIAALVSAFKSNEVDHKATGYNETQARTDFISPMLEAFGWDVHNTLRQPIGLREVFEEATVEVGPEKLSKKPDYELRLARQRKLFVEAKKPRVDIDRDMAASFQTRRYGFSGSLPISILTNFRQLAVYDCRPVPAEGEAAHVARLLLVECEDFEHRFDELWDLFSRETIYNGAFDERFSVGATRLGAAQFDDLFLAQVQHWRSILAVDIHRSRPELKPAELTYVVQLLISRIVFLRICEDRDIEVYESLRNLATPGTYAAFHAVLEAADRFYNSGLFRLLADDPLAIQVSDDVMSLMLSELYYPQSPYTFAVVEPEVLGEVYEQFLGEEIVIDGDQVEIVYKPEVRESGGVVPTPRYIVDAIVDRTVAPRIAGQSPADLANFTIADLCCGSGIFLLSAYDLLLDHYLAWYVANDRPTHLGSQIYEVVGGHWRLTFAERRRILLTHIRGVDIDANAVEIARLSLLLKLIENETRADLDDYVQRVRAPALPSLDGIVRSGNSLVSFEEWDAFKPDGALPATLNPFSWPAEFPADLERGGFDVIVGNPPYTRIQIMQRYFPEEVDFYQSAPSPYRSATRNNFDKYALFIERSLQLQAPNGRLGLIVPHKFMATVAGRALRAVFSADRLLEEVVHFGAQQVFGDVANYTCILIASGAGQDNVTLERVTDLDRWRYGSAGELSIVPAASLTAEPWEMAEPAAMAAFQRMRAAHPDRIGTEADIFVGLQTSADDIYAITAIGETATHIRFQTGGREWQIEKGILKPFLRDVTLTAYRRSPANSWLVFPYEAVGGRQRLIQPVELQRDYPDCWAYLSAHREQLDRRAVAGGPAAEQQWYQFGRSQSLGKFDTEKLIVQVLSLEPRYAFDDAETMFTGGGNGPYYGVRANAESRYSLRYLLAVLSHPFSEAMIRTRTSVFRGGYYSHGKQFLVALPVPDPGQAERDRISALAGALTVAFEELDALRLPPDQDRKKREIVRLRERIETAVTAAFGLTAEELNAIKLVKIPN